MDPKTIFKNFDYVIPPSNMAADTSVTSQTIISLSLAFYYVLQINTLHNEFITSFHIRRNACQVLTVKSNYLLKFIHGHNLHLI